MKKTFIKNFGLYFLSFFIPFVIAFLVFYSNSISGYPFSGLNTILTYDLQYGMMPLYSYLSNLGNGFNNLFFSTTSGLGGDYFGGFVFYVSPTDLIYSLIPLEHLPDAVFWSTVLKIGFCGLSFFTFTQKSKKLDLPYSLSLIFSGCYALMSYNFTFSSMPMWADLVILLPLLAIYVERLALGERSLFFVFLLAFTIIDNYYIAYMVIISLFIFFLFNLFEKKTDLNTILCNCFRFSYHFLLAIGVSMLVILPVIFNLMGGKLSGTSNRSSAPMFINSFWAVIRSMFSMNYSNLELYQSPNIYCGSLIVLFIVIWLFSKEKIRTKVLAVSVLVFYFISFIFGFVNTAWHGFSSPVGYCSRFSFTYCFFVLYYACRFFSLESINQSSFFLKYKKLFYASLSIFTYLELFINDSFIISSISEEYTYQNKNDYLREYYTEDIVFSSIKNDRDVFRCAKNFFHTCADGMMYGYNDLSYYNSSFNANVNNLLSNLGLCTQYNMISDYGLTPPIASLLNVKYYVSYFNDTFDYYDLSDNYGSYYIYENNSSLPIAFICDDSKYGDFSEDTFHNINLVYDDLFDFDDELFVEQVYTLNDDFNEKEGRLNYIGFSFVPDKDGHYFFYRTDDINYDHFSLELIPEKNTLEFFVNGEDIGSYSLYNKRYCTDLGYLNAGQDVSVILETYPFDEGKIYLYYYNSDLMKEISERTTGFDVVDSGWHGLSLSGYADSDSNLIVTLPYERGYNITINGEKADYDSYRDTLLMLHLKEGKNDIEISYIPYGFKTGLICSSVALVFCFLIFRKKNRTVIEQ